MRSAVADAVEDAVLAQLPGGLTGAALRPTAGRAVHRAADAALSTGAFPPLWRTANGRAHATLIAVLADRSALRVRGSTLQLDLSGLLDRVLGVLPDRIRSHLPHSVPLRIPLLRASWLAPAHQWYGVVTWGRHVGAPLTLATAALAVLAAPRGARRRVGARLAAGSTGTLLLLLGAALLARQRLAIGDDGLASVVQRHVGRALLQPLVTDATRAAAVTATVTAVLVLAGLVRRGEH